jgi:hypothetical protein
MKTGFDNVITPDGDEHEMVQTAQNMFLVLIEESMKCAGEYAKAAGRSIVTAEDVKYAMQYQAHYFQNIHDLPSRAQKASEMWESTEDESDTVDSGNLDSLDEIDTEDVDSLDEIDTDSDSEVEVCDEDDEPFTRAPDNHSELINLINFCHDNWESWEPETYVEKLLKNTVDSKINSELS